jgi:hypothetical protein
MVVVGVHLGVGATTAHPIWGICARVGDRDPVLADQAAGQPTDSRCIGRARYGGPGG